MPVQEVVQSGVTADEHVLLECFGPDLAAVRQTKQLRVALRRAGTPPPSPPGSSATARSSSPGRPPVSAPAMRRTRGLT